MNLAPQRESVPRSGAPKNVAAGPKFQVSLTLMLLLMVVFAFTSAALAYAARVPAIQEELRILFNMEPAAASEDTGRIAHRVFIMFTFTSPLLLACCLSLVLSMMRYLQRETS